MTISSITYQDVVDTVKNWIKANCINITNYNAISNAVKTGYSYQVFYGGWNNTSETCNATITSALQPAYESNVDSDMSTFLTSIGVDTILSNNISPDYFYKFISDMVCFCCTKVGYVLSQVDNNPGSVQYMIYNLSNSSYDYSIPISASSAVIYELIANDIKSVLDYIILLIKINVSNKRILSCNYSYTINSSVW